MCGFPKIRAQGLGFPEIRGTFRGSPHKKDYSGLGSIFLRSPILGKLPYEGESKLLESPLIALCSSPLYNLFLAPFKEVRP